MKLDRTLIVIRERTMLETLDLSLQLIRAYFGPLLLALLAGAAPLLLFNFVFIGPLVPFNPEDYEPIELLQLHLRYAWHLLALMAIQAPLISLFVTPYLGQAVFEVKPRLWQSMRDTLALWRRLLWCVGLRRLLIPALAMHVYLRPDSPRTDRDYAYLSIMLIAVLLLRATRPYLLEIILLERNPLRSKNKNDVTVARRNASLHRPSTADLVGRWLAASALGILVGLAAFGSMLFVQGVLFNSWSVGPAMFLLALPMAVLIVIELMTVFRFLSYLDLRIRQEGWEVELLLRAEGARLRDDLASGLTERLEKVA